MPKRLGRPLFCKNVLTFFISSPPPPSHLLRSLSSPRRLRPLPSVPCSALQLRDFLLPPPPLPSTVLRRSCFPSCGALQLPLPWKDPTWWWLLCSKKARSSGREAGSSGRQARSGGGEKLLEYIPKGSRRLAHPPQGRRR